MIFVPTIKMINMMKDELIKRIDAEELYINEISRNETINIDEIQEQRKNGKKVVIIGIISCINVSITIENLDWGLCLGQ